MQAETLTPGSSTSNASSSRPLANHHNDHYLDNAAEPTAQPAGLVTDGSPFLQVAQQEQDVGTSASNSLMSESQHACSKGVSFAAGTQHASSTVCSAAADVDVFSSSHVQSVHTAQAVMQNSLQWVNNAVGAAAVAARGAVAGSPGWFSNGQSRDRHWSDAELRRAAGMTYDTLVAGSLPAAQPAQHMTVSTGNASGSNSAIGSDRLAQSKGYAAGAVGDGCHAEDSSSTQSGGATAAASAPAAQQQHQLEAGSSPLLMRHPLKLRSSYVSVLGRSSRWGVLSHNIILLEIIILCWRLCLLFLINTVNIAKLAKCC